MSSAAPLAGAVDESGSSLDRDSKHVAIGHALAHRRDRTDRLAVDSLDGWGKGGA